jgi:hypothetical protein
VLSYDDPRWKELKGGYKTPYDPTKVLRKLESAGDPKPLWEELWDQLHHQGDVGESSYATVPHLVRIQKEKGNLGWNFYALVSTIEVEGIASQTPFCPLGWRPTTSKPGPTS